MDSSSAVLPGVTVEVMRAVAVARRAGTAAFFTIDAGPQVKVVTAPGTSRALAAELAQIPGVLQVIATGLGPAASVLEVSR